ncbi:MAG: hypothetical protein ACK4TC_00855 [Sphingomonas pseudosanguinis]|uniref:hypothetical protein n=1 Tax=Sphingomonas pseudosanguinis TaxID=413712 RepID=UPI003919E851
MTDVPMQDGKVAPTETWRRIIAAVVASAAAFGAWLMLDADAEGAGVTAPGVAGTVGALLLSLALVAGFRSLDGPLGVAAGRTGRRPSHAGAAISLWLGCFAAIWISLFASALLTGYLEMRGMHASRETRDEARIDCVDGKQHSKRRGKCVR